MSHDKRLLVLHAHPFPHRSRVNRALRDAIEDLEGTQIRDLYELYPNFHIPIKTEQRAVEQADVIVLQHPFYWYSCPPLLKQWIDDVLELGWAYGDGGTALQGKYWLQVISTGGTPEAYHRKGSNVFTINELLRPFEQTARLCGMTPLKPFLVQNAGALSADDISDHAQRYRRLLESIRRNDLPEPHLTHHKDFSE